MKTRREVTHCLLGLPVAAFLVPQMGVAQNKKRVLVIGAGVSGLAAANALLQKGFDVEILEASNRVGGRLKTDSSLGVPLDLGASWIHGVKGNPLTRLSDVIGAKRVATDYNSSITFDSTGQEISAQREARLEDIRRAIYSAIESAQDSRRDTPLAQTVWSKLRGADLIADDQQLLRFVLHSEFEAEYGGSAQRVSSPLVGHLSTHWHDAGEEFEGGDDLFAQGYEVISKYLAQDLSGKIRLNEVVQHIDYSGRDVKVTTLNGQYAADNVLVTVPLGVLKSGHIRFSPQLPDRQVQALDQLQMGLLNKLYLQFDDPFWSDMVSEDWMECIQPMDQAQPSWMQWVNLKPALKQNILLGFTAADSALGLENMSDQAVVAQAMDRLRLVFGSALPSPRGFLRTRWMNDPWTRGSYSFNAYGVHQNSRLDVSKPINQQVFFAGEHTHPVHFGTVHGAYLSGLRAAKEIVENSALNRLGY